MVSKRNPTLQWRAVHFTQKCAMVSRLNILLANSMITQLQKLWIFYYISAHCRSVRFRSYPTTDPVWSFWL